MICLRAGVVNSGGSECPYALKMVACQLLLEITTFLRERYQAASRSRLSRKDTSWDKQVSTGCSSCGHFQCQWRQ